MALGFFNPGPRTHMSCEGCNLQVAGRRLQVAGQNLEKVNILNSLQIIPELLKQNNTKMFWCRVSYS